MRCYLCAQIAVTSCRECQRPVCHGHTRRGNPRDTKYNGGKFFKHDYCTPCYDTIRQETIQFNCMCALFMIPIMIVIMLMFGAMH